MRKQKQTQWLGLVTLFLMGSAFLSFSVLAQGVKSVDNPLISDKQETDLMTHEEINQILGALRGIYNDHDNANNLGIGGAASAQKLNVNGSIGVNGTEVIGNDGLINPSSETDPGVGAVSLNEWCRGNGTQVVCDQSAPVTSQWDDVTGGIDYAGGNVGIGSNAPSESLQVVGNIQMGLSGGATQRLIKFSNHNADPGGVPNKIQLWGTSYGLGISSSDLDYVSAGNHRFHQGSNERFTILSSGNVGIGTTAPSELLSLSGDGTWQFGITSVDTISRGGSATDDGLLTVDGNLLFQVDDNDNQTAAAIFYDGVEEEIMRISETGPIFDTDTGNRKAYISRLGGITNQSVAMWVDDSHAYFSHEQDENSGVRGGFIFQMDNDGTQTPYFLVEEKSGTDLFKIDTNGDSFINVGQVGIGLTNPSEELEVNGDVLADAFLYTSDASLKSNVHTIPDALEKVLALEGVEFDWKENGQKSIGLTAQNIEQVFPELVTTSDESGLKSVQYGNLIAPLIEAVKSQQKEIDALRNEVQLLKKDL